MRLLMPAVGREPPWGQIESDKHSGTQHTKHQHGCNSVCEALRVRSHLTVPHPLPIDMRAGFFGDPVPPTHHEQHQQGRDDRRNRKRHACFVDQQV
jgi:hypothetical protein